MEKKPHRNQYEEPHFTCVIHYTEGCEKYISEFQQKKVAILRKHLELLNPAELEKFCNMLEEVLLTKDREEQS
ncbi:hypothetical protein [Ruminococcus sp.]|jgi:hypothetical protein|uniref:hypothetical protein n=1 Tax=Ruminococcus sp. TaxID=41978 RepID=UPI0025F98FB1|nr:hypothetical protein [Ruminococcus sp.]